MSTGGGVAPAQSRRASPGSSASGPGPELLPGRQLDSILLRERVASAHKRPRHRKRPALTALAPRKYAFFHDRAISIHPLNRPHGPAPPIPPSAQGERGIQKAEQRGDESRGRDRAPPHCVRSPLWIARQSRDPSSPDSFRPGHSERCGAWRLNLETSPKVFL